MKAKLVLLLAAAVGSTTLVASAQSPKAYVVTDRNSGEGQDVFVPTPVPPAPPAALTVQPPRTTALTVQPPRNMLYTNQVPYFAFTEDNSLSRQAEQLAQQLAGARSDSDRDKIKSQLAENLEKQFDQRQKRHEEEIKQLEAQIKKLKDLVDKRQENRREIITRRLDQIVKESQGLGGKIESRVERT